MAVTSKSATGETGRWAFIVVITLIVAAWCAYDGFFKEDVEYKSFNKTAAVVAGIAAVASFVKLVWAATLTIEAGDEGLRVRGRRPIPWSSFTQADTSRLEKGIITLKYKTETGAGTLKLDDFKITSLRELIEEINDRTNLDIKLPVPQAAKGTKAVDEKKEGGGED